MDIGKNEDGKYLRIIDYKSSAKDIDLNEVYAGLQIQLLTYMDAICKEEDLIPAGILYFSLTNFDCVPLPEAGGAIKIILFKLSPPCVIPTDKLTFYLFICF